MSVFQINNCFRISRTFIAVWSSEKKKTFRFAPSKEQNPTCDVSSAALFAMAKRSLVSDSDRNSSINVEKVTFVKLQFDFLVPCTLMDNLTTTFQTCQINRLGMFGMASFLEPLIIPNLHPILLTSRLTVYPPTNHSIPQHLPKLMLTDFLSFQTSSPACNIWS